MSRAISWRSAGVRRRSASPADSEAARLLSELQALGVDTTGIVSDSSRCTTRKLRVVTTRNQQVARIDYERDAEIDGAIEDAVVASVVEHARTADAVLVSDYLKGVISRSVARACVKEGERRGIPVLVDPKVPHIDYYKGATVITPNHHEAESITNLRIRTADEARTAAARVRSRARCQSVLITRASTAYGCWRRMGNGSASRSTRGVGRHRRGRHGHRRVALGSPPAPRSPMPRISPIARPASSSASSVLQP